MENDAVECMMGEKLSVDNDWGWAIVLAVQDEVGEKSCLGR